MNTGSSGVLRTVVNETTHRCNRLLEQVDKIPEESFINDLIKRTGESLLVFQAELHSVQSDMGLSDPRLAPNFAIKLSRIIESIHEIQDGPLSALLGYSKLDKVLNQIMTFSLQEIRFPYAPPVVSTSGRIHFACLPKWNLVFAPPTTEHLLTTLPDLFHELGHLVWDRNRLRFQAHLLPTIDEYIDQQTRSADSRLRNEPLGPLFRQLRESWRWWVKELFSDAFAAFVCGPSYASSHIRYCIENVGILFYPGKLGDSCNHPSDAIRLEAIVGVLSEIGLQSESRLISDRWAALLDDLNVGPPTEYNMLYPAEVIEELISCSCKLIESIGIQSYNSNSPSKDTLSLIALINKGWKRMSRWDSEYSEWESSSLENLLANSNKA